MVSMCQLCGIVFSVCVCFLQLCPFYFIFYFILTLRRYNLVSHFWNLNRKLTAGKLSNPPKVSVVPLPFLGCSLLCAVTRRPWLDAGVASGMGRHGKHRGRAQRRAQLTLQFHSVSGLSRGRGSVNVKWGFTFAWGLQKDPRSGGSGEPRSE